MLLPVHHAHSERMPSKILWHVAAELAVRCITVINLEAYIINIEPQPLPDMEKYKKIALTLLS